MMGEDDVGAGRSVELDEADVEEAGAEDDNEEVEDVGAAEGVDVEVVKVDGAKPIVVSAVGVPVADMSVNTPIFLFMIEDPT